MIYSVTGTLIHIEPGVAVVECGGVGLETLAAAIGEEAVTLEDVYEPYLMQIGFLSRTPRGRCATRAAYLHLGLTPPGGESDAQQSLFHS